MKKLVLIALALAIVLTASFAFADEMPTVKISGLYFSKDAIPAFGTAPATDHSFDYSAWATAQGGSDTMSVENGVITYVGGTGWFGIITQGGRIDGETNSYHDGDNAIEDHKYMAYKIENVSSAAVESSVIFSVACSDGAHSGEVIVNNVLLYNTDGTQATDVTYSLQDKFSNGLIRGYLNIPAGKAVWVVIPMTATNIPLFEADADNGALSLPEGTVWEGVLDYMNQYFAAYQTTLNWAPVDQPSDDPTDTADISVIAYAAAAITGLGALAVAKRR